MLELTSQWPLSLTFRIHPQTLCYCCRSARFRSDLGIHPTPGSRVKIQNESGLRVAHYGLRSNPETKRDPHGWCREDKNGSMSAQDDPQVAFSTQHTPNAFVLPNTLICKFLDRGLFGGLYMLYNI